MRDAFAVFRDSTKGSLATRWFVKCRPLRSAVISTPPAVISTPQNFSCRLRGLRRSGWAGHVGEYSKAVDYGIKPPQFVRPSRKRCLLESYRPLASRSRAI
jgi:hypothetical protein